MDSDDLASAELELDLSASKVWFDLKILLLEKIAEIPDGERRYMMVRFIDKHWPGHAPRSREIASLVSANTRAIRDRDRLKNLLMVKPIERKR